MLTVVLRRPHQDMQVLGVLLSSRRLPLVRAFRWRMALKMVVR